MKAARCLTLTAVAVALAQSPAQPGDAARYRNHDWFALRERVAAGAVSDPLTLGATAAAFGENEKAHRYLEPLLKGKQAEDASQWLTYLDMREGRYQAAAALIEATSKEPDPLAATFRELPDQATESTSPAIFPYRYLQRKLFVPASVNGHPVELIVDTDANLSFVSETLAKRIGLAVRQSSARMAGAKGATSQFSVATADVAIGNTRLRNVAFTVLPDSAILFATLRPEQQGALGLPVLLALERVSWDHDGNFRIGQGYDPSRNASMLAFDGADPIVLFTCRQVALAGIFDTGAETTDLFPPFAAHFSDLLRREGVAGTKQVRGFGGEGKVPDIVLPKLDLFMGGITLRMTSADVLTAQTTADSEWLAGRVGLDLLRKARGVTIDFSVNKVQLRN